MHNWPCTVQTIHRCWCWLSAGCLDYGSQNNSLIRMHLRTSLSRLTRKTYCLGRFAKEWGALHVASCPTQLFDVQIISKIIVGKNIGSWPIIYTTQQTERGLQARVLNYQAQFSHQAFEINNLGRQMIRLLPRGLIG